MSNRNTPMSDAIFFIVLTMMWTGGLLIIDCINDRDREENMENIVIEENVTNENTESNQ